MIEIKSKTECCGCEACKQICPKKCVEMCEDDQGFRYPVINQSECINCNLCSSVCPILNEKRENELTECYGGYFDNDEVRFVSSSGGLFTALALKTLEQAGIVFGATLNADLTVSHIGIETIEDLPKLRGSKYLQSNINDAYKKAKEYLDNNRKVLFSGTSCQINGLKNYLRKDYDNLYTIDVICHGVPSEKIWRKYIDDMSYSCYSKVNNAVFRDKENGWKGFNMKLDFDDYSLYRIVHKKDKFMRLFLTNIALRPSCYACQFKSLKHGSDLTIGDFWKANERIRTIDDDKGLSCVIINSSKGKEMFEAIKDGLNYMPVSYEEIKPGNLALYTSVKKHKNYDKCQKALSEDASLGTLMKLVK